MDGIAIKGQNSINQLKEQLAPILRRHGVARAVVFGSMARGDANKSSDLDLSVEFKPEIKTTLFSIFDLQYEIEDLLGKKVHISLPENLKPFLRERIIRELIYIL